MVDQKIPAICPKCNYILYRYTENASQTARKMETRGVWLGMASWLMAVRHLEGCAKMIFKH
jgi:hypothetical protein